jgi:hypothetical protein
VRGRVAQTLTTRRWQWLCIAAIVGVFALSFFLPVAFLPVDDFGGIRYHPLPGWEAYYRYAKGLLLWVTVPGGHVDSLFAILVCVLFVLLPNILFAAGIRLLLLRRHRSALVVGVLASLDACYPLLGWLLEKLQPLGLGSGYFVWLASMVLLALAGACFAFVTNPKAGSNRSARPAPSMFPDPGALALFNQPQANPLLPTEVRSDTPPGGKPSSLQPPCSPSS